MATTKESTEHTPIHPDADTWDESASAKRQQAIHQILVQYYGAENWLKARDDAWRK